MDLAHTRELFSELLGTSIGVRPYEQCSADQRAATVRQPANLTALRWREPNNGISPWSMS